MSEVNGLHTPEEWCEFLGAEILDPDGWRGPFYKDWNEPITKKEFDERYIKCTVNMALYCPPGISRPSEFLRRNRQ